MLDISKLSVEQIEMLVRHLNTLIFAYRDMQNSDQDNLEVLRKTFDKHMSIAQHFVDSLPKLVG